MFDCQAMEIGIIESLLKQAFVPFWVILGIRWEFYHEHDYGLLCHISFTIYTLLDAESSS